MENFRITVFRAVAERASFRKASEYLHLSQPAVSQQVHALEEELGVRLFDRGGNRVQLTDAGRILLEYAHKSARLAQETRAALAEVSGKSQGELRLGASTTVAQYVLPRMLGLFQELHPNIKLSVVSGNTEDIVARLVKESVDIGMIEGPALKKHLHIEPFLEDSMVLIAPASDEWAGSPTISLKDLASLPMLMREHGSGSRRVVEEALQASGLSLSRLRIEMELDSTEAIVSTVEAGLGVGFVSTWAVRKELLLGTVVQIPVKGLEVRRQFTLVRPLGPSPSGATGIFWQFALEQMGLQAANGPKLITKTNRR
jgi:LysR family transcriptional regulator, transcriptional activator of the cysJI operon